MSLSLSCSCFSYPRKWVYTVSCTCPEIYTYQCHCSLCIRLVTALRRQSNGPFLKEMFQCLFFNYLRKRHIHCFAWWQGHLTIYITVNYCNRSTWHVALEWKEKQIGWKQEEFILLPLWCICPDYHQGSSLTFLPL